MSNPRFGAPVAGVLLIAFGLVFLASQTGWIPDAGDFIARWWPMILILIGLTNLVSGARTGSAYTLLVIGAVFLAVQMGYVSHRRLWQLWPVLLIVVGIAMVLGALGGKMRGAGGSK